MALGWLSSVAQWRLAVGFASLIGGVSATGRKIVIVDQAFLCLENYPMSRLDGIITRKAHSSQWFLEDNFTLNMCETKVWLILILMITKQGLELMIIFQVWLGKTISKVAITKINHEEEDHLKEKSFSKPKLHKISL